MAGGASHAAHGNGVDIQILLVLHRHWILGDGSLLRRQARGGVTLHAELTKLACGLALSKIHHGLEDRIFHRVGMGRNLPLFVVLLVAYLALIRVGECLDYLFSVDE